jgi:5-methylcytosine-specific restriction protein A
MSGRPMRRCPVIGCPTLVVSGRCAVHQQQRRRESDARRPNANQRLYTTAWSKARTAYLAKHPLCVTCLSLGQHKPATVVDHSTPHRGDQTIFWDSSRWVGLCARHHNQKTATQDGGFGRRPYKGANGFGTGGHKPFRNSKSSSGRFLRGDRG